MWIITATSQQCTLLTCSRNYPEAQIFSWQTFVEKLDYSVVLALERYPSHSPFLNSIEEHAFFRQSMSEMTGHQPEHNEGNSVIFLKNFTHTLVTEVQKAWWLLNHFCVDLNLLKTSFHEPSLWLYRVIQRYQKLIEVQKRIDKLAALRSFLSNPSFENFPKQMAFYGFLRLTPLQEKMLKALESHGIQVKKIAFDEQKSGVKTFEDTQEKSLRLQRYSTPEEAIDAVIETIFSLPSNQRIALITTELSNACEYMESQLQIKNTRQSTNKTWRIQLPKALVKFSTVQTALTILSQQGEKEWSVETLAMLSRSPYWGIEPHDFILRAKWMYRIRKLALEKINVESLLSLADAYPDWKKLLHGCILPFNKKKQAMHVWVTQWKGILHEVAWVDDDHFNQLLDTLSQSFSTQLFSYREALAILRQACQQTLVSHHEASTPQIVIAKPIDILSEHFDHIFWLDVTQNMSIIPVPVNTLIDPRLQRAYHFWAQDPSFNENLGLECFEMMVKHCKHVHLSFPKMRNDREQQPASFCKDQPILERSFVSQGMRSSEQYLSQEDTTLDFWPHLNLPGGSGALKSQRLCSMQAFAKYRLDIKTLPKPELGLTAIERGIVTHRALQLIWEQLETQEALATLARDYADLSSKDDPALAKFLDRFISLALQEVPYLRRQQLPQALFQLERKNMRYLLERWLKAELTRPPFKIHSLEQTVEVMFAERQWRLRIDRIDELQDGRLLLMDYKTGATSINACLPENFTEPQLPLYAVTHALKVDAIALAEFSAKQLRCSGLTQDTLSLGDLGALKVVENWEVLIDEWKVLLASLTKDFVHSQAQLQPLDGQATCQQCGLQSFCRVNI